jgi:hypothetical protein
MDQLTLDTQFVLGTGIYEVWSSSFSAQVKKDGEIIARFAGETAWMDAERFVNDRILAETYGN